MHVCRDRESFDRTLRADCPIDGTQFGRVDASPFERSRLRGASVEPRVLHDPFEEFPDALGH
jgi:hypothetical protein